VHVYSALQDRKQPFSYLGVGIFIVLVNCFSEPSSVKIFLSYERESKTFCSYHVEQKYIFLTGDSRIFDFMLTIPVYLTKWWGTCSSGAAEPRPLYILILMLILDPISDCCLTKSSLTPNFLRIIQAKTYTPFQTVVTKSMPHARHKIKNRIPIVKTSPCIYRMLSPHVTVFFISSFGTV
jgi:hypothetical protein